MRLVACSCYRQIAREIGVSPTTVLRQVERLGRQCLLFHDEHRPRAVEEPIVIDGFESFEFSQYTPVHFHVAVGARSHFVYGFTDSELRRKGRMTRAQRNRRTQLEQSLGRPDPRSIEKEVRTLLQIVVPEGASVRLRSDRHPAYRRALRALEGRRLTHERTASTETRDTRNPLFAANLLDLLLRHSSANHKRETIAFSKRRQSAAERLFVWIVWRNYLKSFSERARDATPAQRLGVASRRLGVADVLERRIFPTRSAIPARWAAYYWRQVPTRAIPNGRTHQLRYAF